jgi:biopolymer transport protein ExbD
MKKILILISYLIIFYSCKNSEKLEGHWHLKNEYSGERFLSLDLIKNSDSIAYFNKYSFNDTQIVRHYSKEKNLITGECGGHFEYKLNGKKVHLKNVQDYGDYFGKQYELTDSHKLKDYLNNLLVDVVLPKVKNSKKNNSINFENDSFIENLVIGKSKEPYKTGFEESYKIQANERFLKLEEIDEWVESIKNRTRDEDFGLIKFRIVSDKNVPLKFIKTINQKIHERGLKKIFLTYLRQNEKGTTELFEYLDLAKIKFKGKVKLQDLVE